MIMIQVRIASLCTVRPSTPTSIDDRTFTESDRLSWIVAQPAAPYADSLHLLVLVQSLLRLVVRRLQVEHDLLHGACEGIRSLVLVGEVDDQAVVAADVHARVGREEHRHRTWHPALADLLVVGPQRHVAAGARLGLVGLEQHLHGHVAGRDLLRGHLLVGLDAQERVGVVQQALVVDPQPEAADEVGVGDDDALGTSVRHVQLRLDSVRPPDDAGDHAALHVLDVPGERVAGDRGQRRQDAEEDAQSAEQRQRPVALGLLPPQLLQFLELVGVLCRQVPGLREVVGQVVQLPHVLLRVVHPGSELLERLRREVPGSLVQPRTRPPAILVDGAAAEHLEVLHGVPLGSLRILEGVEEAGAVHRLLLDPVDCFRLREANSLEDGGADVDAVGELRAQIAVGLDPVRPGDDHRVARPTQVARHLLAPLERRIVGVGPGRGEVRRGVIAAQALDAAVLLDQLQLLLGIEHDAVEEGHLVERAGDRPFHAGAVVTPDVEDEGIVEVTHLLDRVEQPADVPVGVLGEAREDLHLPGVELLLGVVERVPGREQVRPLRSDSVSCGTIPSFFWRSSVSSRYLSQPSSNLPLYLSAHSFATWCGAWLQPVE